MRRTVEIFVSSIETADPQLYDGARLAVAKSYAEALQDLGTWLEDEEDDKIQRLLAKGKIEKALDRYTEITGRQWKIEDGHSIELET